MRIHTIDLHYADLPHAIACFLVEGEHGLALIETGPGSTLPACLDGLRALGIDPAEIRHVIVTHIHFDHAGAAGWWATQGAHIYVHRVGAPHLIDPSRLLASARQVYGESLERQWGAMLPVPAEQLTALDDGDVVSVGDLRFTAWDTPGHARHHHCLALEDVVFTGDIAGCRLPGERFISPTAAPPQFDPDAYVASIERVAAARPRALYLTHFGLVEDPADHLARYREIVLGSAELVRAHLRNGADRETLAARFDAYNRDRAERDGVTPAVWAQYNTANPFAMSADGIALYWSKQNRRS